MDERLIASVGAPGRARPGTCWACHTAQCVRTTARPLPSGSTGSAPEYSSATPGGACVATAKHVQIQP